ncbi:MAG TPA: hypothetical protein VJA40_04500 [archaeon]|nr:hypothetical protein [archaeon]
MNAKALLFIALLLPAFAPAHDHPDLFPKEHYTDEAWLAQQPLWNQFVYNAWGLHDKVHFIVILLMLWTCYHFRYWVQKHVFKQPERCERFYGERYAGERKLHHYHRYFWYANALLIGVHWWEAIEGWNFLSQGRAYTYTFYWQDLGVMIEALYLITFTAWLLSCHFFKYAAAGGVNACYSCIRGGKLRSAFFKTESHANEYHGFLMWAAIAAMVLQILVAGHL